MRGRRHRENALDRARRENRPLTVQEFKQISAPKGRSEHEEQCALVRKVHANAAAIPALKNFYAVPNQAGVDLDGGPGGMIRQAKMVAEGLADGYPDCGCDVARGGYHGWRCEMKRPDLRPKRGGAGGVKPSQAEWHARLKAEGYYVIVSYSGEEAWADLLHYLSLPR